jgi:ADP-glucose pyrophosphorylase
MGDGTIVMQNAVVNTDTVLGRGVLINCGAIVDHDNVVGEGVHVGLGAVIKACCRIEPCQKIEAGVVIKSTRQKIDGVENQNLEDAIYAFPFHEQCSFVKPFGSGHINDTYALFFGQQESEIPKYILQH